MTLTLQADQPMSVRNYVETLVNETLAAVLEQQHSRSTAAGSSAAEGAPQSRPTHCRNNSSTSTSTSPHSNSSSPQDTTSRTTGSTNNSKTMGDFVYFGAGPAKLPTTVLERIQGELLDLGGSHVSILEMSHRSPEFMKIVDDTVAKARKLLNIPDNYQVLFMQGGGTGQFSGVPLNLIGRTGKADYIVTGSWSAKAAKEAEKYGQPRLVAPKPATFGAIPDPASWSLDPEASYVYYCDNETVEGVEFHFVPETNGVPLVADMSSNIFSKPIDISKYGLIYAGAQKNIGPAGVTIVIVRDDLLNHALPITPNVLSYKVMAKENSLHNTPPCFAIYAVGLVFDWILENGGVEEMERRAIEKSDLLYNLIDKSNGFYTSVVDPSCRSRMNVPFRVKKDEKVEEKFLKEAKAAKFLGLKGHRSVGGIRASIYNAILPEQVSRLGSFIEEFAANN
ncbi:unnamed protein product [Allacma fusca]|uniref:phosphoserine transaminase n=1 Tax=Allacma fusca TaxID=39272 RepID=A0A8J2KHZ3_9HEXA|nr:unnamed protein product [Allacma fusca]